MSYLTMGELGAGVSAGVGEAAVGIPSRPAETTPINAVPASGWFFGPSSPAPTPVAPSLPSYALTQDQLDALNAQQAEIAAYARGANRSGDFSEEQTPAERAAFVRGVTDTAKPWYQQIGESIASVLPGAIKPVVAPRFARPVQKKFPGWVAPVAVIGTVLLLVTGLGRRRRRAALPVAANPFGRRRRRVRRGRYSIL